MSQHQNNPPTSNAIDQSPAGPADQRATFQLNLAGQHWSVQIPQQELDTVHLPLLRIIMQRARAKGGRYVVFLAGPPGSGKTTIGALWETLAREYHMELPALTLPMDGFHYPNAYLDQATLDADGHPVDLRAIKGAPETFDLPMITRSLHAIRAGETLAWPRYDRQIHDPVPDAIPVIPEGVLLVEGNYLLLDEKDWRDLRSLADLTIFIECGTEEVLRERLLERAQRGGRTYASAVRRYDTNERPNWKRVMEHRVESAVVLRSEQGGGLTLIRSAALTAFSSES